MLYLHASSLRKQGPRALIHCVSNVKVPTFRWNELFVLGSCFRRNDAGGFLSILLILCFFFVQTQPCLADQPNWDKIIHSLDTFVTDYVKEKKVPGCIVAIVGPHDIYFLKSYGVKKLGQTDRITTKTLFQLGSVSKTITATLLIKLYDQNAIDLEEPITTYLSDFKLKDQEEPLTIRHLLSHTSGVPRYGFNALIETHPPRSELLRMVQTVKPAAHPGESFDYHNVMFALTEDILHVTHNQRFDHILEKTVFSPLSMAHACVGLNCIQQSKDRASPHIRNKKGQIIPLDAYSRAYYAVSPAGGINASMEDMIPFLKAHLGGRPNVLSSGARSLLHLPQVTEDMSPEVMKAKSEHIDKMGYALGWRWMDYGGERVVYHGGWLKGFHTMVAFLPEHEVGIIVLHNAETNLPWKTTCAFLDQYLGLSKS